LRGIVARSDRIGKPGRRNRSGATLAFGSARAEAVGITTANGTASPARVRNASQHVAEQG
jgi:hypothetical protein